MGLFEQIKDAVTTRQVVEKYHAPLNRNKKVPCPFHQEKTPSLSIEENSNMWKCFGCGVGGDAIRFLAMLKGIEDFEAAKLIVQDFSLNINFESEFNKSPTGELRSHILQAQKHIGETNYFIKRGLTEETIKQFGLGYDPSEKKVLIPYSPKFVYYQTRGVEDRKFRKPKSEKYGSEPLWHPEFMERRDKTPIFIVESPICAMSITQYGGVAVALCGVSNAKKFAEDVAKRKSKILGTLVIWMDNDDPGKEATQTLVNAFKTAKVKHIVYEYEQNADYTDPNDLLIKSANRLCKKIEEATQHARRVSLDRKDLMCIQEMSELGIKPKPFIVENMIPEDALCMLVAASKVGKSWLVLQLAIAIVLGKEFLGEKTKPCRVVYYALEDSHDRMIWRKNTLTNNVPLPKKRLITRLETLKGNLDTGFMDELRELVTQVPGLKLIIIDTFQMVRGTPRRNEGAYAYDNRELATFRKFCADYKVTILFVHHSRKQEDDGDTFNMISGSMAIMGAADATFFIGKKKRMDANEPYKFSQTGRDVKQCERYIERSEHEGSWTLVGNAEEQAKKRENEAFNSSKVVKLILELMKRQPSGWSGTTAEFVKEGIKIWGEHIGRDADVGREINSIEFELLRKHKINHEWKRSSKGNKHFFTPSKPYSLFSYSDQEN